MAKLKLSASLIGEGIINNGYIYLEILPSVDNPHAVPIGLFPVDSKRKEWTNENISIEVIGTLEIQINVHAFKGTKWTLKLTDLSTDKEIYSKSGQTGNKPDDGLNISIVTDSITLK